MSTRIINLTSGLATLPAPYRGALAPGRGGVLSDSPATVLANLGGVLQVEGIWRLDITDEPGQAAFDPAPGAPSAGYPSGLPDPTTVGASVANPVMAIGPSGALVYSDGTAWYNYEGALT
jgi:hypothetical protein